jgi:2-C-methyl-D-erythritol 2,4-cyclodiphosphate synthase
MYFSAIGQDSHRFEPEGSCKPLTLGGMIIPRCVGLSGNSDADVVLHAITNAISGIHGTPILGKIADDLCLRQGIKESAVYLKKTIELLRGCSMVHISVSIEAQRPKLAEHLNAMRESIANLCSLPVAHIAITATSGEGLTAFGRGEGIQALAIVSARCE